MSIAKYHLRSTQPSYANLGLPVNHGFPRQLRLTRETQPIKGLSLIDRKRISLQTQLAECLGKLSVPDGWVYRMAGWTTSYKVAHRLTEEIRVS